MQQATDPEEFVPMLRQRLDHDLIAYLLEPFVVQEGSESLPPEFSRCVDHPDVPNHVYYEGYYHGLRNHEPVLGINPRMGWDEPKQPAPLRLRAFCECIRQQNRAWMTDLLKEVSNPVRFEALFGDIAVQIHYGDAIGINDVKFHIDASNSLLHCALSLSGRRVVHYNAGRKCDELNERKEEFRAASMEPGDLYMSSPACFIHGVEYPEHTADNPVVAVQCRCFMDVHQLIKSNRVKSIADRNTLFEALKNSRDRLSLPTLVQVKQMEVDMTRQRASPCALL